MKRSNFNIFGGVLLTSWYRKGGQAVAVVMPSIRLPKGGQRYSLIGGNSYGC